MCPVYATLHKASVPATWHGSLYKNIVITCFQTQSGVAPAVKAFHENCILDARNRMYKLYLHTKNSRLDETISRWFGNFVITSTSLYKHYRHSLLRHINIVFTAKCTRKRDTVINNGNNEPGNGTRCPSWQPASLPFFLFPRHPTEHPKQQSMYYLPFYTFYKDTAITRRSFRFASNLTTKPLFIENFRNVERVENSRHARAPNRSFLKKFIRFRVAAISNSEEISHVLLTIYLWNSLPQFLS